MIYRFLDFELDTAFAELRCKGDRVAIEPQVFELLKLLITVRDRVVTRDEIFSEVWGDRFVSDAALSSRIRDARKVIGDDGKRQNLIRTIHGRGLRFVGEVVEAENGDTVAAVPVKVDPVPFDINFDALVNRPAVAVLQFTVSSGDESDRFLAEGLANGIASALSAWRVFPVVSPNDTYRRVHGLESETEPFSYRGAKYILGGTFRRSGGRFRLHLTLTDTEENHLVWSDQVTHDFGDAFDLEEEVSAQIVSLLVPELEAAEARRTMRRPPEDLTGWELAMRASWLTKQGQAGDFAQVEQLASKAIELSPEWSFPYTLIAIARFEQTMLGFSIADSQTAFEGMFVAAKRALEIDRSSWIANALTAVGELWTNRNHERALLHVDRAIELNPSAPINYHFGGCIAGFSGEPEIAKSHHERLFRLDRLYPYTAVVEADLGLWHLIELELQEAEERLLRSHKWDPRYGRALQRQIALAGLNGDCSLAAAAARKLSALGGTLNYEAIAVSYPFKNPDHSELFLDGLRRSGVNF